MFRSENQTATYKEPVRLKAAPVVVDVDRLRFACYEEELETFAADLSVELERLDLGEIHGPLTQLTRDCARILDAQLIKCMGRDMAAYRALKGINAKTLSINDARLEYEHYIKTRGEDLSYAQYIKNTFPHLSALFTNIVNNYVRNISIMLQRIQADMDVLQTDLLSTLSGDSSLIAINPTGSDYHLQGNQVFILEFSDAFGKTVKLVYKPTSVVADAMIVGDVERLSEIDRRYAEQQSMLEKFNEYLDTHSMPVLPKYSILPREDESFPPTHMKRYYGYSQYLSHKPFADIDYDTLLEEQLKTVQPARRGSYIDEQFPLVAADKALSVIGEAGELKECDYITDDEEVIKQYSFECGMLIVLMMAAGLVDSHYGNLIIHKLHPYLIDNEACLTQSELHLGRLLCLNVSSGSMSRNSNCEEVEAGVCLFDLTGHHETAAKHPEKNLIFSKNAKNIIARQPCEEEFKQGYETALQIVREGYISSWFEQSMVQMMPVRLIVYPTDHFTQELKVLLENGLSATAFEEIRFGNYEAGRIMFESAQESELKSIEHPMGCIYANERILEEYANLSIPYYYGFASGTKLYDFNGDEVVMPSSYLSLRSTDAEHKDFFLVSPLANIRERVEYMMQPENAKALGQLVIDQAYFFGFEQTDISNVSVVPRIKPAQDEPTTTRCILS